MRISFSPQRRDDTLTLIKSGETLIVNGDPLDFSQLQDGGTYPTEAIDNEFVVGPVHRIDGEIHITILIPHGPDACHAVAFPQPINVTHDGRVDYPKDEVNGDAD